MKDKKIAVHVTNEEQWNEVRNFYRTDFSPEFIEIHNFTDTPKDQLVIYDDGAWGDVDSFNEDPDGCDELLEFNEWQDRVKGENMEKIEVPQAVYDDFKRLDKGSTPYVLCSYLDDGTDGYHNLFSYLFNGKRITDDKQHQLELAKVMAGEAEFAPIEESYYWQDNQGMWLVKNVLRNKICLSSDKKAAGKLTETEIREKASFDIDKLKKASY